MKRFKGCLGVFLVFFFGVLFGCAITAGLIHEKVLELVEGGPEKITAEMVSRLKKDLKLDGEQQEMLQQIAMDTRIKLRSIRQATQPDVEQTLDAAAARVRGILNPQQTKKFDEIIKKGREKWKSPSKSEPAPATPTPAPGAPDSAAPTPETPVSATPAPSSAETPLESTPAPKETP